MRYTASASLTGCPATDLVLMQTPYESVLAAITLDTKLNLRFVRTGSAAEGARVALVNVATLIDAGVRHWDITLSWDPHELAVAVGDRHDERRRPLKGAWRPPGTG
ncbi:MAG: hypothetical protein ACLGI5_07595 [Thermoleophilia bacterium]